jgi:hypothetical protein
MSRDLLINWLIGASGKKYKNKKQTEKIEVSFSSKQHFNFD